MCGCLSYWANSSQFGVTRLICADSACSRLFKWLLLLAYFFQTGKYDLIISVNPAIAFSEDWNLRPHYQVAVRRGRCVSPRGFMDGPPPVYFAGNSFLELSSDVPTFPKIGIPGQNAPGCSWLRCGTGLTENVRSVRAAFVHDRKIAIWLNVRTRICPWAQQD